MTPIRSETTGQTGTINSIGITCLLQIQDHCRRQGAALALAGVPASIAAFLKQLKLDSRFTRYESLDDAVAVLDRSRE
jgi:anti-anti-sigma regulatory factor